MEILRQIERQAIAVTEDWPHDPAFMTIDEAAPRVELPMDRPLFTPTKRSVVDSESLEVGLEDIDVDVLFDQVVVDRERLERNVRLALDVQSQITLPELLVWHPLEQGLAEMMTYLSIASESTNAAFDETTTDVVVFDQREEVKRRARIPRVIFSR